MVSLINDRSFFNNSKDHVIIDSTSKKGCTLPVDMINISHESKSISLLRDTLEEVQDHLIPTKWGQSSPWNSKAPYTSPSMTTQCPTGCVMVAAAQLLRFLYYKIGFPKNILYEFDASSVYIPTGASYIVLTDADVSFGPIGNQQYWGYMPLYHDSGTGHDYVSSLMVFLGYQYGAHYRANGTGSSPEYINWLFPNIYGIYSSISYTSSQYDSILYNQIITNAMPVVAGIHAGNAGHAIIIDGFKRETETIDTFTMNSNSSEVYQWERSETTVTDFVAINWGWNGIGDSNSYGSTIWYNLDCSWYIGGYSFDVINHLVYGFYHN